jgi:hypothetical protein
MVFAGSGGELRCCVLRAGCFDSFLNVQIVLVLFAQVTICLAFALGSYAWREHVGYVHHYLALDVYRG